MKRVAASVAVGALLALAGTAQAGSVTNVSAAEHSDYTEIYELAIGSSSNFSSSVPYSVDNSGTAIPGGIDRIAYYLELDSSAYGSQWIWVSVDAFTQDLTLIGVPGLSTGILWQQYLSNMNVQSNVGSIVTGTGITTGNIEFWPYNYQPDNDAGVPGASSTAFDFGDWNSSANTYGSMQIHNYGAGQTLFAFNAYNGYNGGELGIGNQVGGSGNPDWTFAGNAGSYTVRSLEIWVLPTEVVPLPSAAWMGLGLLGGLGIVSRLRKRKHAKLA